MAENINITKPAPYIESAGKDFLKSARTIAQSPRTAQDLGVPTQAGLDPFSQQAQDLAASQMGLGAYTRDAQGAVTGISGTPGVAGYEQYLSGTGGISAPTYTAQSLIGPLTGQQRTDYMSPYQTAVKQAGLDEFDAQKLRDQQKLQFDAQQAGAFGGGRHGLAESDFLTQSALDRQRIASGFDQQAYQDALNQRGLDFGRLTDLARQTQTQGLGSLSAIGSLGTQGQQYGQAGLDTLATANRMQGAEPMERVGWYGNMISQMAGGMPSGYSQQSVMPQGSPAMQAAQTGLGLGNIFNTVRNIWNTA
jgi:hypothetical protein